MRKSSKPIADNAASAIFALKQMTTSAINRVSPGFPLLVAMAAVVWRQALFAGKALVHGDTIVFSLPLFDLRSRVIYGHASALWADTVFGGHPLFSEGQTAFLSPLPMLLAAALTPFAGPIYTQNFFHFVCMVLTGAGVLGLCGSLGISRWASAFAALAVAFAPVWVNVQNNAEVSGTFMWVPWCLWAFEIWLRRPDFRSAVVLALAGTILFVAGYPQAVHGTIIYMTVSLVTIPFYSQMRDIWKKTWRVRLTTGVVAAVLCIGMAAILWIPMLQLVGLSHRSAGVGLEFQAAPEFFFRGMLYSFHTISSMGPIHFFPGAGSLLVCLLASWGLAFDRSPRVAGHFIAALVLLQLGFGTALPTFNFVYDHNLVPGLHYFRVVFLYMAIGIVAVAVVAAAAIDGISRFVGDLISGQGRYDISWRWIIGTSAVLAILWIWGLLSFPTPTAPLIEFLTVFGAVIGVLFLAWFKRSKYIPLLMTTLLVVECCFLRLDPFGFYNPVVLRRPTSVAAIQALPHWQDFKVIDLSSAPIYSFMDSRAPGEADGVRRMLSSMSGSTPMLWGIHGMDGALALPLSRRKEVDSLLASEILGKTVSPPGFRLLDILGIRFITLDSPVQTPAFHVFRKDYGAWIMENTAALPRFQLYDRHVTVDTPAAAIATIWGEKKRTLVIENAAGDGHQHEMPDATDDGGAKSATFKVLRANATRYDFVISAERPVWFFLADANYPGWRALLDGRATPVFSAQILGKAVGIPQGRHTLSIQFHSATFARGAWISVISLVFALLAFAFGPSLTAFLSVKKN